LIKKLIFSGAKLRIIHELANGIRDL